MASRLEWAHANDGYYLVGPAELEDLTLDDNDAEDYGVAFGEGVILYGQPDELFRLFSAVLSNLASTGKVGDFV